MLQKVLIAIRLILRELVMKFTKTNITAKKRNDRKGDGNQ